MRERPICRCTFTPSRKSFTLAVRFRAFSNNELLITARWTYHLQSSMHYIMPSNPGKNVLSGASNCTKQNCSATPPHSFGYLPLI